MWPIPSYGCSGLIIFPLRPMKPCAYFLSCLDAFHKNSQVFNLDLYPFYFLQLCNQLCSEMQTNEDNNSQCVQIANLIYITHVKSQRHNSGMHLSLIFRTRYSCNYSILLLSLSRRINSSWVRLLGGVWLCHTSRGQILGINFLSVPYDLTYTSNASLITDFL